MVYAYEFMIADEVVAAAKIGDKEALRSMALSWFGDATNFIPDSGDRKKLKKP